MIFVELPDGFTVEKGESNYLVDQTQTWRIRVHYKKRPAFEMTKDFDVPDGGPRYAARSIVDIPYWVDSGGYWQEFSSLEEMVLVMCTKHIMGVK